MKSFKSIKRKYMSDKNIIKAYIVMERELIYNDNTYDLGTGGQSRKAFLSKEEAAAAVLEANVSSLINWNWNSHLTDLGDLDYMNADGLLIEKIKKYGGIVKKTNGYTLIANFNLANLTRGQAIDILESLSFDFFYLQDVELE